MSDPQYKLEEDVKVYEVSHLLPDTDMRYVRSPIISSSDKTLIDSIKRRATLLFDRATGIERSLDE